MPANLFGRPFKDSDFAASASSLYPVPPPAKLRDFVLAWATRFACDVAACTSRAAKSLQRRYAPYVSYIYRINHWRDPAFATLWHLLDTGLAPTDPLVQGIKFDEIKQAKAELMAAVDAADKADDRARRLLD